MRTRFALFQLLHQHKFLYDAEGQKSSSPKSPSHKEIGAVQKCEYHSGSLYKKSPFLKYDQNDNLHYFLNIFVIKSHQTPGV